MITFTPLDIAKLGLLMALACGLGLGLALLVRRRLAPGVPFDMLANGLTWIGLWALGMLLSLITELTIAAGQPGWLKTVLFVLLLVLAVSISFAERRHALVRRHGPSEPIHGAKAPG
jgi:drug/metabolite transporter (DMT)-like permease